MTSFLQLVALGAFGVAGGYLASRIFYRFGRSNVKKTLNIDPPLQ